MLQTLASVKFSIFVFWAKCISHLKSKLENMETRGIWLVEMWFQNSFHLEIT